jgi:hypothetical protein
MPLSEVHLITAAPRQFAAVRTRLPVMDVTRRFREFLDQVYAAKSARGIKLDGQNIFAYRPTEDPNVVDAEFGVGVTEPFAPAGNVIMTALPAGLAATVTLLGDYSGIASGHRSVVDWCKASGHDRTGTRWEIYGHWTSDASRLQTDIYHQVATA